MKKGRLQCRIELAPPESPIETTLRDALVEQLLSPPFEADYVLVLRSQEWIGRRRTDFTLRAQTHGGADLARLIIEADGERFHEGRYDDARDAELEKRAWPTKRFTGAEINADPTRCASDALHEIYWLAASIGSVAERLNKLLTVARWHDSNAQTSSAEVARIGAVMALLDWLNGNEGATKWQLDVARARGE